MLHMGVCLFVWMDNIVIGSCLRLSSPEVCDAHPRI